MQKSVMTLAPGDVLVEDGEVEVLSAPQIGADGRAHFVGRDERGHEMEHRMQPTWTVKVK